MKTFKIGWWGSSAAKTMAANSDYGSLMPTTHKVKGLKIDCPLTSIHTINQSIDVIHLFKFNVQDWGYISGVEDQTIVYEALGLNFCTAKLKVKQTNVGAIITL